MFGEMFFIYYFNWCSFIGLVFLSFVFKMLSNESKRSVEMEIKWSSIIGNLLKVKNFVVLCII